MCGMVLGNVRGLLAMDAQYDISSKPVVVWFEAPFRSLYDHVSRLVTLICANYAELRGVFTFGVCTMSRCVSVVVACP
jgi:hypothetical protein